MWLRLRQIALVASELQPVLEDLRAVLGLEVCHVDPGVGVFGLENSLMPVGNQFIEVVAPVKAGTAGGRYLDRRGGDGGYMFITQTDDHPPRKKRAQDLGVRLVIDNEQPDFRNMQLHPRDTGGTFLEIDWQRGGEAPDGPWWPAGPDWKPAVRTDVVRSIRAAEIQSPDPEALARRWSEILEIPVERDGAGRPELRLDNARARFVEPPDGRPEGLAGLDLEVADRERALRAARERGLAGTDDVIHICGMRLRLVD